eukprot:1907508-Prymnesium_polylepis.1
MQKTNTHRARETTEAIGRSATATATHGEAEMRRAGATAVPRQDEVKRLYDRLTDPMTHDGTFECV